MNGLKKKIKKMENKDKGYSLSQEDLNTLFEADEPADFEGFTLENFDENKYYVPKIEEFHIGFWYYGHRFMFCKKHELEWIPLLFGRWTSPRNNDRLNEILFNKGIKVKYLDSDDIESFGFKKTGKTIDQWYALEGSFSLPYTCFKIVLSHSFNDKTVRIFAEDQGSEDVLFRGTIKNKYELQKLLRQLNIITTPIDINVFMAK